jgi:tRNA 2-thiouridine synthesizing protein A
MSLKKYKDKMEKPSVKELNIKGKMCPMTFVYTKLALEEMEKGEIIEVTLDFPPAIENIPDSCKRQGIAEVLGIEKVSKKDNIWKILLKKT